MNENVKIFFVRHCVLICLTAGILFAITDKILLNQAGPTNNAITFLIYGVLSILPFLKYISAIQKKHDYYAVNNKLKGFITFGIILFIFGLYNNHWSSFEKETNQNEELNAGTFDLKRIIQFPYKEHEKSKGFPDTIAFSGSPRKFDNYHLFVFDKTGSTNIDSNTTRALKQKIIQAISSISCDNDMAAILKDLKYRDLVLLNAVLDYNTDIANDRSFTGNTYIQCFCYLGNSEVVQMFEKNGNIFSWTRLNNETICDVLLKMITALKAMTVTPAHKTNLYNVIDYLTKKSISFVTFNNDEKLDLSFLSDFDNDADKSIIARLLLERKLDQFVSTNKFGNVLLLKQLGNNIDYENQAEVIKIFEKAFSGNYVYITDETKCIVDSTYNVYNRGFRHSLYSDSMHISFVYPIRGNSIKPCAQSVILSTKGFKGDIKIVTEAPVIVNQHSYFQIKETGEKLHHNKLTPFVMEPNKSYTLEYYGENEINEGIFIQFSPEKESNNYYFKVFFKGYIPPLPSIVLQILYILLLILINVNYLFKSIILYKVIKDSWYNTRIITPKLILYSFFCVWTLYICNVFLVQYIFVFFRWYCIAGIIATIGLYLLLMCKESTAPLNSKLLLAIENK